MSPRSAIADERGVATIMMALAIPLILVVCVLGVDVANWFVHKRHLQTQADAAALAGAGVFTFPSCDNTLIRNTALRYSGKGDGTATYNDPAEVKTGQARLFAEINKSVFHNQSHPNEGDLPAEPCDAKFVDVKMTETDLPWFFGTGIVPNINAEARVKLFQVTEGEGLLPLGVQEAAPRKVRAYIVDEATGNEIPGASIVLSAHGSSGGLLQFDNESAPLEFALPAGTSPNLGVRLALGGATSTTCGDPLVNCYDSASNRGLHFLRTWADAPTVPDPAAGAEPIARSVYLSPGDCDNASFTASKTACTMNINAKVKWNPSVTATDLTGGLAKLTATFNGNNYPLTYNAATTTWTAAGVSIPAGTIGPRNVTLAWEQQVGTVATSTCKVNGNPKACSGTFGTVQRSFWNNPDTQSSSGGPVGSLNVLDSATLQQVSDLQRCATCTASLIIQVGIKGALGLDAASDPPRALRVSNSGSQNQTLDCDPSRGFVDEIAYGCTPRYAINKGTPCSTPTTPVSCVPVQTGTTANKPAQGFNTRFLCQPSGNLGNCKGTPLNYDGKPSTCPGAGLPGHNNWPSYKPGDPRVVAVFLVPFGTFETNGNQLVPIIDFAAFYVTGWSSNGAGFANPCIGNGDQFVPGTESENGVISGHFVKNVNPNVGGNDTETCDFSDVGQCAAVLVK